METSTLNWFLLGINAWLPSTSHVPCGSVSHTLPHTLSLPHVFPFETHALMGNLRFHSLNHMETSHVKVGNITLKEETPFASLYVGLLLPITHPLSNGHLTLHFTSHAISPYPKIMSSHWLLSSMSCLVPWMFDTC
jgi:hypothetical protein